MIQKKESLVLLKIQKEKDSIGIFLMSKKINEDEIKDCEIYINDKKIDFTYYYKFNNKGKYIIKYKFKKLLNSTNFMFFDCNSLSSLDFSNFNTQNVTNMKYMFAYCNSLSTLDLSNFNTQNVTNMEEMFYNCFSLLSLYLFNFNTQNIIEAPTNELLTSID